MSNIRLLAIVLLATTAMACKLDPLPTRTNNDAAPGMGGAGGNNTGANADAANIGTGTETGESTGGATTTGGGGTIGSGGVVGTGGSVKTGGGVGTGGIGGAGGVGVGGTSATGGTGAAAGGAGGTGGGVGTGGIGGAGGVGMGGTGAMGGTSAATGGAGGTGGGVGTGGIGGAGGVGMGGTSAMGGTGAATGGVGGTGGTKGAGATIGSGGNLSTGGVSNGGSGGTTTTAGMTASGGTTSTGGALSTGGATTMGGTTASGGTSSAGGTTATGGAIATGGTATTGGALSTGGATTTGGTTASGGTSGSGGAGGSGGVTCPSTNPTYSLVDGFEDYATGSIANAAPWVRYSISRTANVGASWAHTGKNSLEVASFTTSTEVDYLPLGLPGPVRDLVVEFWFAPDGYYVYKDFASFGVGTASSKYDFTPTVELAVTDHSMTAKSPIWGPQEVWSGVDYSSSSSSPVFNYVRLNFALCDQNVTVYAGPDASAPLRATVPLPADFSFNAFYVSGGLNPTHLDDIVIYTPGTTVDRSHLQSAGPTVVSSFASPGSACAALAWDGASFWFLDDVGHLFQLSSTGQVLKTIDNSDVVYASDFAWDGSSLWALDVGYSTGNIAKVDTNGHIVSQIGPVSTWAWSGLAWDGQYFWVGDYNAWTIRKYDTTGRLILKWDAASFDHPSGMATGSAGIWYAAGSEIYYQSFTGDVLQTLSLADLGIGTSGYCIEWDGTYLWYSGGFTVSKIALTRPGS